VYFHQIRVGVEIFAGIVSPEAFFYTAVTIMARPKPGEAGGCHVNQEKGCLRLKPTKRNQTLNMRRRILTMSLEPLDPAKET
jgi:hypothetical protein